MNQHSLLMGGRGFIYNQDGEQILCGFTVAIDLYEKEGENARIKAREIIRNEIKQFKNISETPTSIIYVVDILMTTNFNENAKLEFNWYRQKKWWKIWNFRFLEFSDVLEIKN